MFCLHCESITLRGANCETCGQPLPGLTPPPEKIANKAGLLKQQLLLYRSGDMTRDQFLSWLDKEEDTSWAILDETDEKNFSEDTKQIMNEELRVGRKGVATYLQALDSVREWTETGRNDLLQTAQALTANADNLMDQAFKLNFDSFKDIIEATREYLRQTGFRNSTP